MYFDVMNKLNYLLIGVEKDINLYLMDEFLTKENEHPNKAETLNLPVMLE